MKLTKKEKEALETLREEQIRGTVRLSDPRVLSQTIHIFGRGRMKALQSAIDKIFEELVD